MKHLDFVNEINQDPEYLTAKRDLQAHFALGDAILRARLERGWSQAELATRAGTKQANISRIEAGLANPTLNLIQKIMQVLALEVKFNPVQSAASTSSRVYGSAGAPREFARDNPSMLPTHVIHDGNGE